MYSAEDCLKVLLEFKETHGDRSIFRGEARCYPSTLTSLARLPAAAKVDFSPLPVNLASHIWDHKLSPHLKNCYGFTYYKDEQFGARDILDGGHDCEPRHTSWGLSALMQHYGIPTDWVDFTRDPQVALAFASEANDSPTGFIYYCETHNHCFHGKLIDVARFTSDLRQIFPLPLSRPEKQAALAFRPSMENCARKGMNVIEFSKNEGGLTPRSDLFPPDAMRAWFVGQIVDYYIDFTERANRYSSDYKDDSSDAAHQNYIQSLERVITEFELWNLK